MHVNCKHCGARIAVSHRPGGSTNLSNVQTKGVHIEGGSISFGPGGSIGFGPGGSISFGTAPASEFVCVSCGRSARYESHEILD